MSQKTAEVFGRRWLLHTIRNIPRLASWPTLHHMQGIAAGVPAVIVNAGPSVDVNAHSLEWASKRALIFAGNHSLDILDTAGVRPDVVGAIDAGAMVAEHTRGREAGVLFTAPVTHPYVLDGFRHRSWAPANMGHDDWMWPYPRDVLVPNGGSVSCTLLILARALGCSPIILVGQDLAMTGGRYYPSISGDRGVTVERCMHEGRPYFFSKYDNGMLHEHGYLLELPGWGGGTVETSIGMHSIHTWFSDMVTQWDAETPGRFVNATEGGARIAGAREERLADVLATLPSRDGLRDLLPAWIDAWNGGDAQRATLRAKLLELRRSMHFARQHSEVASELLRRGNHAALKDCERALRKCVAGAEAVIFGLDRRRFYLATQAATEHAKDDAVKKDCAMQFYRMCINADILVGPALQEAADAL